MKRDIWLGIWGSLERVFQELPLVVRHKSKRQDAIAENHLQEASAALAEATEALKSATESLSSQTEHHQAVHLRRFLGLAAPLLAEFQGCFGRNPEAVSMPSHVVKAIEFELGQLDAKAVSRYLRAVLLEHPVGDALAVLANDDNGVGQTVLGLTSLLKDPGRAELVRAYVTSLGTLSSSCEEVEIGPGVAIGIGDMPSAPARILFAQRFLASKGAW